MWRGRGGPSGRRDLDLGPDRLGEQRVKGQAFQAGYISGVMLDGDEDAPLRMIRGFEDGGHSTSSGRELLEKLAWCRRRHQAKSSIRVNEGEPIPR
jgi:hypothetical protein